MARDLFGLFFPESMYEASQSTHAECINEFLLPSAPVSRLTIDAFHYRDVESFFVVVVSGIAH